MKTEMICDMQLRYAGNIIDEVVVDEGAFIGTVEIENMLGSPRRKTVLINSLEGMKR